MFSWEQSTYTLFIGIAAGAVLVLPFTGKIYEVRRKLLKKIRPRGWYTIIAFGISVFLGVDKDKQAKKDQSADKSRDSVQRIKIDSTNRKFTEESNAKIVNTFATSLAKYGLKYDSTRNIIEKLVKDSSKNETKIYSATQPQLYISNIEALNLKSDTLSLQTTLSCNGATAYNVRVSRYEIIEYSNDFVFSKDDKTVFTLGEQIPATSSYQSRNSYVNWHRVSKFYHLFKGLYYSTPSLKGQPIPFKQLYLYDLSRKMFGIVGDKTLKHKIDSIFHVNQID